MRQSVKQGSVRPIFTGRNEVVARVIFLHLSVIHSVHRREGVCLSACWDTTTTQSPLWADNPPRSRTPPRPDTPRTRHPLGEDTPLEQNPPDQTPPPPRSRTPPPDHIPHPPYQTPPTPPGPDTSLEADTPSREADSSIRSTRGRYASYWNAFLFRY